MISLSIALVSILALTFIFYWKSIKLLREQSEYEQKSTRSYVKNLQCYSIAHLLTYAPSVVYVLILSGYFAFFDISTNANYYITLITEGIASLAGFINSMIFLIQGPLKENLTSKDLLNMDLSLTIDRS